MEVLAGEVTTILHITYQFVLAEIRGSYQYIPTQFMSLPCRSLADTSTVSYAVENSQRLV